MNIESLTLGTPPPRAPSPSLAPQTARTEAAQVKKAETKALDNSALSVDDDQSRKSTFDLTVEDAVKRISDFVAPTQSEISFSIDDVSGVQVVKIMDSQSNEVIRQFPSKEAIEIARALDKLQGLLIRDKA